MASYELIRPFYDNQHGADYLLGDAAYLLGVNGIRMGISKERLLNILGSSSSKTIAILNKGVEESSVPRETYKTLDFSDVSEANSMVKHFQEHNPEYEVVGMLHIESSGDSFYTAGQGSQTYITLHHKNNSFYAVVIINNFAYAQGSQIKFITTKPVFFTPRENIHGLYDELDRVLVIRNSFEVYEKDKWLVFPELEIDASDERFQITSKLLNFISEKSLKGSKKHRFPLAATLCRPFLIDNIKRTRNPVLVTEAELLNGLKKL